MLKLSRTQACRFLLAKHCLQGERFFTGKQGILDFIRQVGCIQFDPIDVCGKNAELVLQSRVEGFTKSMLYDLLYKDRLLVDCFDKNLSILPIEDYPYFAADRAANLEQGRSRIEIDAVCVQIQEHIRTNGPVCSADLRASGINQRVDWYWARTSLSRAALETLYFRGELAVHHKKGTIKYYDLAKNCLPPEILAAPDPLCNPHEHLEWRVLRRIGAVGLLWNKPSDAWLNIPSFKAGARITAFKSLLAKNCIVAVTVENLGEMYALAADLPRLEQAAADDATNTTGVIQGAARCELLAPLDNLLWDRNLIRSLWDFDYKWEIYTPVEKRRYGYYVLPILYGDRLVGRIEPIADKKAGRLEMRNIWYESDFCPDSSFKCALDESLTRFATFNDCKWEKK